MSLFLCIVCILMLTTNGKELREQNPDIISELNELDSPKVWMAFLEFALEETLERKAYFPSTHITNMYHKTCRQMDWCVSRRSSPNNTVIHARNWAPCGYVQIHAGIKAEFKVWHTRTSITLVVQLHFSTFQTDTSRAGCRHSTALGIAEYSFLQRKFVYINSNKNRFCGIRKPWITTLSSNIGAVTLWEVNVRRPCNITFFYTSLDKENALVINKYGIIHRLLVNQENFTLISHRNFFYEDYNWMIVVKMGYKVLFSHLQLCCFSGKLKIYEGEEKFYLILQKESSETVEYRESLQVTAQYFSSLVHFHAVGSYHNNMDKPLVMLEFEKIKVQVTQINKTTLTTVKNFNRLFYTVYKLPKDVNFFPNVSFTIRSFFGLNGENCHYGGFLIGNDFTTGGLNISYNQGPFCNNSYATQPMVGENGPKFIVLGNSHYYIIVYAFGPYYNIDFDIQVVGSKCEGVFEPLHMCSSQAPRKATNHPGFIRHVAGANFNLLCFSAFLNGAFVYTLRFYYITRCVLIQTASLNDRITEVYTMSTPMNVHARFVNLILYKSTFKHYGSPITRFHFKMVDLSVLNFQLNGTTGQLQREVSALDVYLINNIKHQGTTLALHMNAIEGQLACAVNEINSTRLHFVALDPSSELREHYNLDITNTCGDLIYGDKLIYSLKFGAHVTKEYGSYSYAYVLIHSNLSCIDNCTMNCTDLLTYIGSAGRIGHSVKLIRSELYLDMRLQQSGLVYEKRCNTVMQLQYRTGNTKVFTYFPLDQPSVFTKVITVSFSLRSSPAFFNTNKILYDYFFSINHHPIFIAISLTLLGTTLKMTVHQLAHTYGASTAMTNGTTSTDP